MLRLKEVRSYDITVQGTLNVYYKSLPLIAMISIVAGFGCFLSYQVYVIGNYIALALIASISLLYSGAFIRYLARTLAGKRYIEVSPDAIYFESKKFTWEEIKYVEADMKAGGQVIHNIFLYLKNGKTIKMNLPYRCLDKSIQEIAAYIDEYFTSEDGIITGDKL